MENLGDSISKEIRDTCRNKEALCAFWAAIGECEANPGYMKVSCAPSCHTCEMIDLDKLFLEISASRDYNVTVHSGPEEGKGTDYEQPPWVITIDDFLTEEECATLIELGRVEGYERSKDVGPKEVDGSFTPMESQGRTSENAWCSKRCRDDPAVQNILHRIENLVKIPQTNYEDFQVLQYN